MGPKQFATFALPARGELIVGRGGGAGVDVKLDDAKASRRHLRLHVGGPGARGRDRRPGQRERHAPPRAPAGAGRAGARSPGRGDRIGSLVLMVQPNRPARAAARGAAAFARRVRGARGVGVRARRGDRRRRSPSRACGRRLTRGVLDGEANVAALRARPIDVVGLLRSRRIRAAVARARRRHRARAGGSVRAGGWPGGGPRGARRRRQLSRRRPPRGGAARPRRRARARRGARTTRRRDAELRLRRREHAAGAGAGRARRRRRRSTC